MTIITDEAETISRPPTAVIAEYLRHSISITYLLGQIWSGRWLALAGFLIGLGYGSYTVWVNPAQYVATMRVSPAESDIGGATAGGGGAGLLADLTGSMGTMKVPKFTQFTLSLSSTGVADLLIKRHDMLCRVYKGECDAATHTWRARTGWRESISSFLAWLGHLPDPNAGRTDIDLANYIRDSVRLDQPKQSAIATLTFVNRDPKFAADFISKVTQATDDYIKQQSREIQRRYVDYLTASAARTLNVEQRTAIDALLLQNERQLMLTEVNVPYAAQIMDGPTVVPIYGASRTLAVAAFIGLIIGAMIAACRDLVPRGWRFW